MIETGAPVRVADNVLVGRRIVLTRPRDQAGDFEERIRSLGGEPVVAPAIAVAPPMSWDSLDFALHHVADYAWLAFTSGNAVSSVAERLRMLGLASSHLEGVRLAAIGKATAEALARELRAPEYVADSSSGRALGESMPVRTGARVLIPHGDIANDALAQSLRNRGALVTSAIAYRTVPGEGIPVIVAGVRKRSIDALLFASGSALRFVVDALEMQGRRLGDGTADRPAIFCIGPATADVAHELGITADAIARDTSLSALIDATVRWFAAHPDAGA